MISSLSLTCSRLCQSVRNPSKGLFTRTKRSRYPLASFWCTLSSSPYPITSSSPSSIFLFRLSFRCFLQCPLRSGALILTPLKSVISSVWTELDMRFFKPCASPPSFAISVKGKSSSWLYPPFFLFSSLYPSSIWLPWYLESNRRWYGWLFPSSSFVRPSWAWLTVSSRPMCYFVFLAIYFCS